MSRSQQPYQSGLRQPLDGLMELLIVCTTVMGYWIHDRYRSCHLTLGQTLAGFTRSEASESKPKPGQPYQPVLRRLLHSVVGLLMLGAIVTGYWVYDVYDGRFGTLALPAVSEIQKLHGSLGFVLLLIFPLFATYSLSYGKSRQLPTNLLPKLRRVGQPLWWITINRLTKPLMLLSSTVALLSGWMMKEEWLLLREFYHVWYTLHLLSWLGLALCLALHIFTAVKVGGVALVQSMLEVRIHSSDKFAQQLGQWWQQVKLTIDLLHKCRPHPKWVSQTGRGTSRKSCSPSPKLGEEAGG